MKIISIWNAKGGVGKTNTAMNLAGALSDMGFTVLLVDTDEQLSAYNMHQRSIITGWHCVKEFPKNEPDYDFVIIDHPPSQRKVPSGSLVIVPFSPSKIEYDSFVESASLLRDKDFIIIINRVDNRIKNERAFAKKMTEQGALLIKSRTVYKNAYAKNKTVFNMAKNLYGVRYARTEFKKLALEVLKR